jgi:hypothetical protein
MSSGSAVVPSSVRFGSLSALKRTLMKYFTIDWWNGYVEDDEAPCREYRDYLDQVSTLLPDAIRKLSYEVSLHDAELRWLCISIQESSVVMDLDGWDYSVQPDVAAWIRLTYRGVTAVSCTADPERGRPGPPGYGDLGYDEFEVLEPGYYEHRMLFSGGIEMHIRFAELEVFLERLPPCGDE